MNTEAWLPRTPNGWTLSRVRHVATVETGSKDTVDANDDGDAVAMVQAQMMRRRPATARLD